MSNRTTTQKFLRVTELLPILAILLVPIAAHAGFFSSISQLWAGTLIEEQPLLQVDYSAQFTPLLSASHSSDSKKAVGGGNVLVANGALISTGPVGEDEIAASDYKTGEIRVYTVDEGDALSQIADMYGVTTNTILWANDLVSADDIHPGDTLVILPFVGVRHTVEKNETFSSIIKKYDADTTEVLTYNDLASADSISVGDELMIPGGEVRTIHKVYATPTKSSGVAQSSWLINPAPGSIETQGIHGYNAVDLGSPGGVYIPIRAAAAGKVILSKYSGWNGGYGHYIVISHSNGMQTLYAHLSRNDIGVGSYVVQGQQIGMMGSTGKSTGTHLHFEVRGGRNPF